VLAEDVAGIGVLLWDLARDVVLWAETPPQEVEEVFAPAAERMRMAALLSVQTAPPVASAIATIARMGGDPRGARRELVGISCRRISGWAESGGAPETALVFALAAGYATPGDPAAAYQVGRLARRQAQYDRAKTWLHRAVLLGRQVKDWDSYGAALAGLGNFYMQRGDYPRARKYHTRCLRAARRHGLRSLEGDALHNLCVVAMDVGLIEEVNAHARAAYEVWGDRHPRLPILAHDIASAWMNEGYFAPALQVFDAVLPHTAASERVTVLANICRASAGAGGVERFEGAWRAAWDFIGELTIKDHVPEGLLEMARGAATLCQWERAEKAAQLSLALATDRQEGRIRITAETLLDAIRHERTADARAVLPAEVGEEARALARDLSVALSRGAAAGI
jgi:tetratricopeptide (TPR) repeat protein